MSYSQPPIGPGGVRPPGAASVPLVAGTSHVPPRTAIVIAVALSLLVLFPAIYDRLPKGLPEYPQLHPQGRYSAWLDKGYRDGFVSWRSPSMPLGVSKDRSVVLLNGEGFGDPPAGRDLRTGEVVWQLPGVSCSPGSVRDGVGFCVRSDAESELATAVRVDLATGLVADWFEFEQYGYAGLQAIANSGLTSIVAYGQRTALLIEARHQNGSLVWQAELPSNNDCELISGYVACHDYEGFAVLDAETGEFTVPYTPLGDDHQLEWATDAALIFSDYELTSSYWFTGEPFESIDYIPRTVTVVPNADLGFYYPFEEHPDMHGMSVVDAAGQVVVGRNAGYAEVLYPSGNELPRGWVMATSADASVLLLNSYGGLELIDRQGDQIAVLSPSSVGASLLDGVIVWSDYEQGDYVVTAPGQ